MEKKNSGHGSTQNKPLYIVGIGASAGGLKALQSFFGAMQPQTGIAFVIIQHLSPDYKSMMTELLAKSTKIPVCRAEDAMVIRPDHIYLITPRMNITTMNGRLFLAEQEERQGLNLPIDIFFRSLAEDQKERGIGIILSGTGSDGTRGVRAIKAEGGTVFIQDEDSAEFDGMPRCAIATGLADYILPPEKMPDQLLKFINHPRILVPEEPLEVIKKEEDNFARLFAKLKKYSNVDFTYYKPATVIRRVERRIGLALVPGIDEYLSFIEQNPAEIGLLFKDLLIGVTKFFRDSEAFKCLKEQVVPKILNAAAKRNPSQLRIWDIGCATGEEAYSVAMLIQDYLDAHDMSLDVKLFATDIDQDAIEFAGLGTYSESIAADVDVHYLAKYFDKLPGGYRVKKCIRQMVVYAAHNILNDPPFTKIDLLICRNLLIYMQQVLQKKIFNTINYILREDGYLFLGNSETIISVENAFDDVDSKHRLYRHRHMGDIPLPAMVMRPPGRLDQKNPDRRIHLEKSSLDFYGKSFGVEKFYQSLLDKVVDTLFIINENREIYLSFGSIDKFLTFPKGRSTLDILSMVPKDLALVIASALQKIKRDKTEAVYDNVRVNTEQKELRVSIKVDSVSDQGDKKNALYLIHLKQVDTSICPSSSRHLQTDINYLAEERIEDLEREIHFTRENLQATIEELQTTNEELLAANEELQSTNEELQSVNEELNTVNAEYQNKLLELTELNTDMNNLMTSSDIPTIFLDKHLHIRKFTPAMTKEVNLLEQDVGRPLTDLQTPFFKNIKKDAATVLKNGLPMIKTLSHKKEWFLQRILPFISDRSAVEGVVVTLMRITDQKNAEIAWEMQHNLMRSILEHSPVAIIMTDREGKINFANNHAQDIFGIEQKRLLQMKIDDVKFNITDMDGKAIPRGKQPLAMILEKEKAVQQYIMCLQTSKGRVVVNVNANPIFDKTKQIGGAVFRFDRVAYE